MNNEINQKEGIASWITYFPLFVLFFLIGTETFLIAPLIPTIAKDFSSSINSVAQAVTAYVLVYAVTAPFLGSFSDKFGRQIFIVAGSMVFLLGNLLSSFATGVGFLILSRAVTGLGGATAGPAMWAYIGDTTHPSIRGRIMGGGMAAFSLGQVIGVPIGTYIARYLSWHWTFRYIGIGVLVMIFLLMFCFNKSLINKSGKSSCQKISSILAIWRSKALRLALIITFLSQAANLGAYTYLGVLLKTHFSLSLEQLGFTGIIVGIASMLGALIGGKLADYFRNNELQEEQLVGIWTIILGGSIFGVTIAPSLWMSMSFLALWFLASGAFTTAQQTLLTMLVPNNRAASISWNNSIMYLGTAVGIWTMGIVLQHGMNIGWIGLSLGVASTSCALFLTKFRCQKGECSHE